MGVNRLQNSRFFSKSVKKSVKCGVRVCEAREKKTDCPFSIYCNEFVQTRGFKKVVERLSPVSLSVFTLVPNLLFDCSRVLEYAKIQTVLQSNGFGRF